MKHAVCTVALQCKQNRWAQRLIQTGYHTISDTPCQVWLQLIHYYAVLLRQINRNTQSPEQSVFTDTPPEIWLHPTHTQRHTHTHTRTQAHTHKQAHAHAKTHADRPHTHTQTHTHILHIMKKYIPVTYAGCTGMDPYSFSCLAGCVSQLLLKNFGRELKNIWTILSLYAMFS